MFHAHASVYVFQIVILLGMLRSIISANFQPLVAKVHVHVIMARIAHHTALDHCTQSQNSKWLSSNESTHVRMPRRTAFLFSLILHALSSFANCSIISQSSLTLCENAASEPSSSGGTTCSKKMLVTMGLKAGQKGSESLYANIDRVYQEGDEQLSRLKNPFRIEIQKSEATVTYPLYYKGVSENV